MRRRSVIRFLRGLRDSGKVLLSSVIGVLSLVVNAYLVWGSEDWSGGPYYELYREVITVTAATAAVLIAIVVYAPEVAKVFGETFLAKRYMAGREEGVEMRNAQLLEFLEEHPEATAKEVEEWARNGDKPRQGKGGGAAGED